MNKERIAPLGAEIDDLEHAVANACHRLKAQAQQAGEVVAWSDDDDNELLHVIGMLERVQVGETVTASDRLYDRSVRPRRMTIKDAQGLVGPCVNILRKLHKKLCAQPAAGADVLDAKRYRWLRDEANFAARVAPQVCMLDCLTADAKPLHGNDVDTAIDAAIAASGRQE